MLKSIGMWLLKIFLGGIFNRVISDVENKAENTKKAAILHAESTEKAAEVEVNIVRKQAEVERVYKERKNVIDDPFGADEWNRSH